MVKLGIIGTSPFNGHPYSFSAIFNGYSKERNHWSQWEGIYDYLNKYFPENLPNAEAQVTHVWTQNPQESMKIASASNVEKVCDSLEQLQKEVDAVILARDDFETHLEIAKPFLEKGLPVFIDKPLTINLNELKFYQNYLEDGLLMSCSGLYYAKELDKFTKEMRSDCKFVDATVLNSWEKYGVHMLDAALSSFDYKVTSVTAQGGQCFKSSIRCESGPDLVVTSLGTAPKTFNIRAWTETEKQEVEISNNYAAFKKTMSVFQEMVMKRQPILKPEHTIQTVKTLIAGNMSADEKREVGLDELTL